MSRAAIYTTNTTNQILAAGNTIDLGSVQRRFGCNITMNGDNIQISGAGYYLVNAVVTITGTTAGTVNISLLKDGTAVNGATSTVTVASGDIVTIPVEGLVREYGCCCDNSSTLSFVLTGTAETVNSISVIVEKI